MERFYKILLIILLAVPFSLIVFILIFGLSRAFIFIFYSFCGGVSYKMLGLSIKIIEIFSTIVSPILGITLSILTTRKISNKKHK